MNRSLYGASPDSRFLSHVTIGSLDVEATESRCSLLPTSDVTANVTKFPLFSRSLVNQAVPSRSCLPRGVQGRGFFMRRTANLVVVCTTNIVQLANFYNAQLCPDVGVAALAAWAIAISRVWQKLDTVLVHIVWPCMFMVVVWLQVHVTYSFT